MKKNIFKILLISLLCICFVSNINASLSCDTRIDYQGIKPGGFDVKVYYCNFEPTGDMAPVATAASYSDADAKKDSYTYSQMASTSSKVGGGAPVPLCNYKGNGYEISESSTCTATKTVVFSYDQTIKGTCTCKEGVYTQTPTPKKMKAELEPGGCDGTLVCTQDTTIKHYKCPDGYTGSSDTTDSGEECTKSIPFSETVTEDTAKTQDDLVSDCNSDEGVSNCTCTAPVFTLKCPEFKCTRRSKVNGACYEQFKIKNGPTAYCINPSEHFPTETGNNYQYDYRFDVQKCSSSHSTVDCGYANIMIEGAYYNKKYPSKAISDNSISLALRLWGAHSRTSGFGNVGLANTESNCSSLMIYHTDMPNVYKTTIGYITSAYFDAVSGYIAGNDNTVKNLLDNSDSPIGGGFKYKDSEGVEHTYITCDRIGLVCGSSPKDRVYKAAFALYFNTVLGNSDMLYHLQEIFGGPTDTTPEGATLLEEVVSEGEEVRTYSWIEVEFEGGTSIDIIGRDVIVDCDKVENDPTYEYYKTKVDGAKILPFCQVKVTLVDIDGNPISESKIKECNLKNFNCYSKKFRFALCDFVQETNTTPSIVVHYTKTQKSYSVRKYTVCGSTTGYQTMFAFYNNSETSRFSKPDPGKTTFTILPSCRLTPETCTDLDIRKSEGKCENSKADETSYNDTFVSYVKDPPLNCILNARANSVEYDYSDEFGVNKEACRIFCSDSVEYIMADKIRVKSGRTVKFDIEIQATKMRQSNKLFTSVIRERRSCISKIYVGNNKYDGGYDWEKLYGITNTEILNILKKPNIENLTDLLRILEVKSASENNRKENIDKLLFDLYNCNLYSKNDILRNVKVSNAEKVKFVSEEIYRSYSVDNNFGLSDCSIFDRNGNYYNDCVKMGGTTFEGGAELANSNAQGNVVLTGKKVGEAPGVSMSAYATKDKNKDDDNTIRFSVSKVKYCDNTDCVKYDKYSSNPDNYNIYNGGKFKTASSTRSYDGKTIPNNEFAMFEITTDFGFYNNDKYQVYPDSGYVKDVTSGGTLPGLLSIDSHSYPSSKNAYNACSIKGVRDSHGKVDDSFNRCEVTYNLDYIHTYKRNYKSNNFLNAINEMNQFTCYIDFEPPQTCPTDDCKGDNGLKDNTLYRNIDTTKMFNDYPEEDSNWATQEGLIATANIEASSDLLKQTDEYLEYSITLSPNQIRAIKSDINRTNENGVNAYMNEGVYGCSIEDNTYRNCKSYFLDELRKGSAEGGSAYGTIDPEYSFGVSKHNSGD
ncbi:MAG: hypothetical protein IKR57_04575 [Bacilli bacterium]|nr:hypothetical protein [Bacilli bacterium]